MGPQCQIDNLVVIYCGYLQHTLTKKKKILLVSAWSIWRAPYIPCTGRCVPDSRDKIDFIRHLCHNNRQNSPLVFTFNIPSNCYHKFTIQASYLIFLVHVFHFHHSILTVPLATILSPASFFYPGHPARFSSVEWIPVKVFRKLPLSRRYRLFAVSGSCMSGSLAYVRLRPSTVRTFFTNGGMEKWRGMMPETHTIPRFNCQPTFPSFSSIRTFRSLSILFPQPQLFWTAIQIAWGSLTECESMSMQLTPWANLHNSSRQPANHPGDRIAWSGKIRDALVCAVFE